MSVPVLKLKPGQKELVAKVIERMKAGDTSAFIAPWRNGGYGLSPMNTISGRPYRGWNRFAVGMSCFLQGFRTPLWLTEKQIVKQGGRFIGEKRPAATPIIFCGRFKKKSNAGLPDRSENLPLSPAAVPQQAPSMATGNLEAAGGGSAEPGETYGRFVREFDVFNLEQTVGVKLPKKMEDLIDARAARAGTWTADDGLADLRRTLMDSKIAPIMFDTFGENCYYTKGAHEIHVPKKKYFRTELDMWEAIGHETIHASGHKSLLNRPTLMGLHRRDSDEYCLEEITAVMGSLFLCQEAGVPVTEERERNWTAYMKEFKALELLERNPSVFVQALVHADFATQFILHPETRPDFIKNRLPPDQVEFEFPDFATSRSASSTTVDGTAVETEMEKVLAAAAELGRASAAPVEVERP